MSSRISTIPITFKSQQEIEALVTSVTNQLQTPDFNSFQVDSNVLQPEQNEDAALHNLVHKTKRLVDTNDVLHLTRRELEIISSLLLDQLYVMRDTDALFQTMVDVCKKFEKASINAWDSWHWRFWCCWLPAGKK